MKKVELLVLLLVFVILSSSYGTVKAQAISITKWYDGLWHIKGYGRVSGNYLSAENFYYEYKTELETGPYHRNTTTESGFTDGNYFSWYVSNMYTTQQDMSGKTFWTFSISIYVVWYCSVTPDSKIVQEDNILLYLKPVPEYDSDQIVRYL